MLGSPQEITPGEATIVKSLKPVYQDVRSRLNPNTPNISPLKIDSSPHPAIQFIAPDNLPNGTVFAISFMDRSSHKVAKVFELKKSSGGELVAAPLENPSGTLNKIINFELTGEGHSHQPTLPVLSVGDDFEVQYKGTVFQRIDQIQQGKVQPGTDSYTVAVATPNRILKGANVYP